MSETTDVQHLVEQIDNAKAKPFVIDGPGDRKFITRPGGSGSWVVEEIQPLPNERAPLPPKIVTQAVRLQQVESIIAYVNRFKNANSLLFADIATDTILAIVDYHKQPVALAHQGGPIEEGIPPTAIGDDAATADHTKHTASLKLPFSLEWQTWKAVDGKLMSHVEFASFLEENAVDVLPLGAMKNLNDEIVEDAPSTLYELVRELQIKSAFGASNVIRNGDYASVEMQKGDDVSTKRNVALPLKIDLGIPVYFGEAAVHVEALIRRKVSDGSLYLGVKLVRPEQHRQDEFKRIVREIEQDVALATHYGTPA